MNKCAKRSCNKELEGAKRTQGFLNDPYYRNVEKTAHIMMKVHCGLRGYNIKEEDYRSEEGGIDMCKAWDDWREDGRNEGRTEGRKEGRKEGKKEGL